MQQQTRIRINKQIVIPTVNVFNIPKNYSNRSINKIIDCACKGYKNNLRIINIIFINNRTIKQLNNLYRKHNQATDILSFNLTEQIGELYISQEQAMLQAKENKLSYSSELNWLIVHGMLHLIGFDHSNNKQESEMKNAEKNILQYVN